MRIPLCLHGSSLYLTHCRYINMFVIAMVRHSDILTLVYFHQQGVMIFVLHILRNKKVFYVSTTVAKNSSIKYNHSQKSELRNCYLFLPQIWRKILKTFGLTRFTDMIVTASTEVMKIKCKPSLVSQAGSWTRSMCAESAASQV